MLIVRKPSMDMANSGNNSKKIKRGFYNGAARVRMVKMFANKLRNLLLEGVAIDLGTVNTIVGIGAEGIVLKEKSAVATSMNERDNVIAVGNEAMALMQRTPGGVRASFPMRDGVIADHGLAEIMLKYFVEKALGKKVGALGIRMLLCVPGCVTEVERRALEEAARSAGARDAHLMEESMAAAIGAGLPVREPVGSMVVDIGGGTTDVAVIAMGGVAVSRSVRTGGIHLDEVISAFIQNEYRLLVGASMAEQVKLSLGATSGRSEKMQVRGRNLDSGLPTSITLTAAEIHHALKKPVSQIVQAIKDTLSATPPELAADLLDTGVTLTGGGAGLKGLDELIARETGMPVFVAERAIECVAIGALRTLEDADAYSQLNQAG